MFVGYAMVPPCNTAFQSFTNSNLGHILLIQVHLLYPVDVLPSQSQLV
jgi:hypothetical protein